MDAHPDLEVKGCFRAGRLAECSAAQLVHLFGDVGRHQARTDPAPGPDRPGPVLHPGDVGPAAAAQM